MATQTEQQRKATARKAAARRRNAAKRSRAATKAAQTRSQAEVSAISAVQAQAERAVLIPVGAALVASEVVIDGQAVHRGPRERRGASCPSCGRRVSTNLRRFERRGTTARNRTVRRVKRTRSASSASCASVAARRCAAMRSARRDTQRPDQDGASRYRASGQGNAPRGSAPGRERCRPRRTLALSTFPGSDGEAGAG